MATMTDLFWSGSLDGRSRRVVASALAGLGARAVGMLLSFLLVPVLISYLGTERYGMWVTLAAISGMFVFADLGLGNGLMNLLSTALARADTDSARSLVSTALFVLALVSGLATALAASSFAAIPWPDLLGARSLVAIRDSSPAAAVFLGFLLLGIPLALVDRVRLACQEGHVNGVASAAGSVTGFVLVLAAIRLDLGMPGVAVAYLAGPAIASMGNGVHLVWTRSEMRPRLRSVSRSVATRLFRIGSVFVILQGAVAIAYQSDTVVANLLLGAEAAATYATALRLFMLVPSLIALVLVPLWPAYTDAIARGDTKWVRRALRSTFWTALALTGTTSSILVALGQPILAMWTHGAISADASLLVPMAAWATLSTAFNAIAMLFNAAGVVGFQVLVALVMTVCSVTASVVLGSIFGLPGVAWGTVLAYFVTAAIPIAVYLPRLMGKMDRRS